MNRRPSLQRIRAVARKEFLHLRRDRRMLPIIFLMPVIQLIILGLAANFDVINLRTVVVDQDHSSMSRGLATRIEAGEAFDLVGVTDTLRGAEFAMDSGKAEVVVIIPPGTSRRLNRGEGASIPVWVDGSDTNRAIMSRRYLDAIFTRTASELLATTSLPVGLPDARTRILYNPTLQSQWFMVPGVLVMVLTIITSLLSGMAIVKERENGTIEQIAVTPIRPVELLLGKLAPFVVIGILDGILVVLVAYFGFHVPFRGNLLELSGMVVLYLFSTLAIGLLVSTVSNTQQQAMMSTFLFILPSLLIGGVMYPISNMPTWAQWLSKALPIRYFMIMVRGVFLKGIGFETLWREAITLAVIGAILLTIAVTRFRKRSA